MLKKITLGIRIVIRMIICLFLIIMMIFGLGTFLESKNSANTKEKIMSNVDTYFSRGDYSHVADWLIRFEYSELDNGEIDKYSEFCEFYSDYTQYNLLKMSKPDNDEINVLLEKMNLLCAQSKYEDLVPHYEKLLKNACN